MGYAIRSMLEDSIDSKPPSLIHQLRSGGRFSMLWMPIRTGRGAGSSRTLDASQSTQKELPKNSSQKNRC